jgi:glycosyltransferase involved in cell wall biosynthesis
MPTSINDSYRLKVNKRILFLLPYPLHRAPSQRFRVENLLPLLDEAGIPYTLRPFMDEGTWNVLYKGGSMMQKAAGIVRGFLRRVKTVMIEAPRIDCIFIHREASPLGPPVFEWYLKKILGKKIIYDFDDAIWIPNTSAQNKLAASLKAFWKVARICRWSTIVTGGNDYLCAYARKHTKGKVVRIPTVVDTEGRYNRLKEHKEGPVTIGWTGSHSTLPYLDQIMPALQALQETHPFRFLVIADKQPELPLQNWSFSPWNATTEIPDLLQIDIGVMPLTADPWSEGKCGFKLIQYLSLGIPAVASPVGVNALILEHGVNGFVASNEEAWIQSLKTLIEDWQLRQRFGASGREKMVREYSIASQRKQFLKLFS